MDRPVSVVVHYGDHQPTIQLANLVVGFGSEVVVVANDRTERPVRLDSRVEWLVPERNLGYGGALALAAGKHAGSAYIALNNDIVLDFGTFQRCLRLMFAQPDVGVVGPVLRRSDGSLQSGAARLSRWQRSPQCLVDPGPRTVECTWVTGAIMFVRGEVMRDIGFDGSFFLGAEDVDLCLRARRAGWRVLCCGDSPAIHHGALTITGPWWWYYGTRNRVWLARTHFGLAPAALTWTCRLMLVPLVALADLSKRRRLLNARLTLVALAHSFWRKPDPAEGPLLGEPFPARVTR